MSDLSKAYDAAMAAKHAHFKACAAGCTPMHSKCDDDIRLYEAAECAWMASHHEIVMLRTLMPVGEPITWDLNDDRYRWVIGHVKTCDTCAYRSDADWTVCRDALAHFGGPVVEQEATP